MNASVLWVKLSLVLLGGATLFSAGCSSLSPQIFSERLMVDPGAAAGISTSEHKPPATFEEAYEDAALIQRRYLTAVRDQGNAVPALSAGLIGLSALAMFKSVTGTNTQDMAGAGVLGASAWAFGSTMDSKPRRDVYRAGAEALSCAMAAVEPLRKGQQSLGKPTDPSSKDTLYGRRAAVNDALANLAALRDWHAALLNRQEVDTVVERQDCSAAAQPAPCEVPVGATADERASLERACNAKPRPKKVCKMVKEPRTTTIAPDPLVTTVFNKARDEADGASRQLKNAKRAIDTLEEAGPALWKKSVSIQIAVSTEVDKTIPDLASVLAAGQGMRSVAFGISGLDALKPIGGVQGKLEQVRTLSQVDRAAVDAIIAATSALRQARVRLDDLVTGSLGAGHAEFRKTLNECSVKLTGVKLLVTPSGDSISVALGSTASFFVSGGTGVPSGTVVTGPKQGALPLRLDAGQFRFDYKVEGVTAGDSVILRFTDGAGQAEHLVEVKVTEATAGAATEPKPKANVEVAESNSGTGSPTLADLPPDTRAKFGLAANATDADLTKALIDCQKKAGIAVSGVFDEKTREAAEAGRCRP
jgi:hypothetical protein